MTFDDGILRIYTVENIAENGAKPKKGLVLRSKFFFGFDVLGVNRYYTALEAKIQLAHVVNIPGWGGVSVLDIAIMEDGTQYRVQMIQPQLDENGLRITKLSLERIVTEYDVPTEITAYSNSCSGS